MSTRTWRGPRVYKFDEFELDARAGELRRGDDHIRLQEQPYRILLMLLERPGEVVLRDEIRRRLWPNDTVVETGHGINAAVLRLREALGESAENPRFIETIARRGYRFRTAKAPESPALPSSRYRAGAQLGAGGMGIVYRAEDLSLGREVALKVLSPELAADRSALERFHREARAASALTHPNICTIYGVEEHDGRPAIAMELLEGETLEAVLARGPLPLPRVLEIATAIASALDTAHRKGVAHRDLKPGNVLLTATGVKVCDFGLAKIEHAPSMESRVTESGAILGTLHYMSPEQVQGQDAGAASDIFSFGILLYEMASGRRPFDGANSASVMASILKSDPPPLPDRGLWSIVERCLAKQPEERISAGELRAALEQARPSRRFRLPPVWMTAAAVLLAGLAYWTLRPAPPVVTTLPVNAARLSVSPDGSHVAYFADNRIFVRALDSSLAVGIAGTEGQITTPFWSPDGRSLAFASGGVLKAVNLAGGQPWPVARVNTNIAGAWTADGTILIGQVADGIFDVPASGGEPRRLTTVEPGETRHLLPQILSDRRFLYLAASARPGENVLYAASLDGMGRTPVLKTDSNAVYVPGRRAKIVYERAGTLLAQSFDERTLKVWGEPYPIANGVFSTVAIGTATRVGQFSATPATLAYLTNDPLRSMTVARNWLNSR